MSFSETLMEGNPRLKRTLTLPYVVLYGLGVTVGAGIYVLIGEVIGRAGDFAPLAFLISGIVMLFPAAAFAELTGRMPYAAAEAHFVGVGFNSRVLFLLVGLAVAAIGIVSSAAIAHGAAGYISELVAIDRPFLLTLIILGTGFVACLGIRSSILFAGLLTLIEVGGLLLIVIGAFGGGGDFAGQAIKSVPVTFSPAVWAGIAGSSLLAFFAFIGFEDIDSIAEETVNPQRTLAWGIFLTLGISVAIYMLVVLAALVAVPAEEIAGQSAPLALVFSRTTGLTPTTITLIAILATVNGIIVQIIMAGRVLYGLANRGTLPGILAKVSTITHTPVIATVLSVVIVLALALTFPITELAEWTSIITLSVFILVCASLIRIKASGEPAPPGTFIIPVWVPYCGVVACAALLIFGAFAGASGH
ncbi:MAG: amino acid permease [Pseudomonadota bacterium]